MDLRVVCTLAALLVVGLAGCTTDSTDSGDAAGYAHLPFAEVQANYAWDTTGSWSEPAVAAVHDRLASEVIMVESFDGTEIQLGIFRPDIAGCPVSMDAERYPAHCQTPVIMDAGPYFMPASIGVESTRPPIATWMVPYGYTVVQMSVRGTGGSEGCMELMSMNEQMDVDAMVTWLATQAWSTGSVGMMGRSYDGTTPFMEAALGNPHLKTIVPISGVSDLPDLMFSNGTSEFRGAIMHNYVYWFNYGIGPEPIDSKNSQFCDAVAEGTATGAYTAVTGDWDTAGASEYWQERQFRERIVENYNGSAFIIHGMQDWNVNPRMVVPWINDLQDAGIEVKAWLGQWGHAYPDRSDEHPNTRWDWADTLLRWFDRELKGMDVEVGPAIEVEDHRHDWWVGDSYPPRDGAPWTLTLNGDGSMTSEAGGSGFGVLGSAGDNTVTTWSARSEPVEAAMRISGTLDIPLAITPTTSTGTNIYANLYDVYPDGRQVWIGHGWINTAYYAGGNERQTLVPGQTVIAKLQTEPLEAFLPAGHTVRLVLSHEASGPNADVLVRPQGGPVRVEFNGDSQFIATTTTDFTASPYRDP